MHDLLVDFLILLGVSIPVSLLFQRLRLPTIVGFLATGIIVGPYGARLISNLAAVNQLAEIGVVLLLFTIGLEFSLRQLFSGATRIFAVAFAQLVLTICITAVSAKFFGQPLHQGIFLGFLFSLSSTAIVLKVMSDRGELDTPQAKASIGILIFQDLAVIPMMLITRTLASDTINLFLIGKHFLSALLALAVLFLGSRYIVPLLFKQAVRSRSREVFLVTVLFVCLGTAYAASRFGLSLALGAFIAGLVLADSDYSHQILSDILPFRDIFNAVFFVSIGMLLNFPLLLAEWKLDFALTTALLLGKTLIILFLLLFARYTFRISWIAAIGLSQVGEFSFLLAQEGRSIGLLPDSIYQVFLASTVLTMFITPLLMLLAFPTSVKLQEWFGTRKEPEHESIGESLKNHIVIVGFGLNGKNLAQVVKAVGIPFIVVELNDKLVQEARRQEIPILFGDATRKEVLSKVRVEAAHVVVVAISDAAATRHCVAVSRSINPSVVIVVRTRYVSEVEFLKEVGADIVIPEEFETSVEIFSRVLEQYNIPDHLIRQQISVVRAGNYGMLRGLSLTAERLMKISELFLKSTIQQVVIDERSPAKGLTLQQFDLRKETGATIIAVVRGDEVVTNPPPDFGLQEGDLLVLWGAHQQLAAAAKRLKTDLSD